jgi:hypothetical protein
VDRVESLSAALHALETPGDVDQNLAELLDSLRRTVSSAQGLHLATRSVGQQVSLIRFRADVQPAQVRSSVQLPLPAVSPNTTVTFYAAVPGAFVDLAADLAYALGFRLDELRLDEHLPNSTASGIRGLAEVALINRALGVLIDQGIDPDEAVKELSRRAAASRTNVLERAHAMLGDLGRQSPSSRTPLQ